jgi:predicted HTH domain antitoxin
MPLVISDEVLQQANLTEREALIEFACRLFDGGRLSIGHAARVAGLEVAEMEEALRARNLPRYRYTESELAQDLRALEKIERRRP